MILPNYINTRVHIPIVTIFGPNETDNDLSEKLKKGQRFNTKMISDGLLVN